MGVAHESEFMLRRKRLELAGLALQACSEALRQVRERYPEEDLWSPRLRSLEVEARGLASMLVAELYDLEVLAARQAGLSS